MVGYEQAFLYHCSTIDLELIVNAHGQNCFLPGLRRETFLVALQQCVLSAEQSKETLQNMTGRDLFLRVSIPKPIEQSSR